jgi:aminoglycoside phosphotransferase (APT) family kinase protein
MARIHDLDLTSNDFDFLACDSWHARNRFVPGYGDSAIARAICDALESVHPIKLSNPLVLLHGDFWRNDLLWKDGELAAIIDWEDAAIGEPLEDVSRTRLELHWSLGEQARDQFTDRYLSHREIDIRDLAIWDLAMSIGPAKALAEWGLAPAREHELYRRLERFVASAIERLAITRG